MLTPDRALLIGETSVSCPRRPVGYQMINAVTITNFRSFDFAEINDCRRINVVVGENGSGKTALLESIFLAAGPSPESALRARAWRGMESNRMWGSTEQVDRALWADLFHKFRTEKLAAISLAGDADHNRSVVISFNDRRPVRSMNRKARLAAKSRGDKTVEYNPTPVEFRWHVPGFEDVIVNPRLESNEIKIPPVPESFVKSTFYAANHTYSGLEMANRFSVLDRTFKEKDFVKLFARHFPNVKNISVATSAAQPMLFAEVVDLPEKIPLSLASGGMNKLAAILLAMPTQPGGVVLVDEIENGIYYRRLPLIWESLLDLAKEYQSQVFISTHSGECIEAAAAVASKNPDDFSLIRTVVEDGQTKVRHISGKKFSQALEQRLDIR